MSPLIDEPLKPQSLSNPPAEKGGSAPADNGIERADSSTQLRRLRVRSADSDGVPKATKSYSTVKRVYKRMSDARKHTIASRVTTRHDRASKKRSIMLSTHLTTPKLAQSSSEHIRKSQKKASTEVLENRKPSKYTSDKRILRSAAGSYKKELTLRAHKSPTKNISRVVASTSIRSHKSQRAPPTKRLVKPKIPVYKTKASSLLKKTRKYKKGKKFKNSK